MKSKIKLCGWQSWSPCKIKFWQIKRPCDFSPQKITSWEFDPTVKLKKTVKGWCSWSAFGFNISEEKILDNAIQLKRIWPNEENYVLIDDGWTKNGDWQNCDSQKFPHGIKFIAEEITKMGLKPGLWISPFLADPKSELVRNHPEYFVKSGGRFVNGFRLSPIQLPSNDKYILDLEKPEVILYLRECLRVIVVDWKFKLLKLDFLHSIYFNPKYKNSTVPDKILKNFLSYIKKIYPDVYTIACACPLGPAAGLTDAMRISNDITSPQLDNLWPINWTINSQKLNQLEKNLKCRKGFSKIWNIDPDSFVSKKSTGLTAGQVQKLYSLIKSANGLFFLGDDLTKVGAGQMLLYNTVFS